MTEQEIFRILYTFIETTDTLFTESVRDNCDELSAPIMNYVGGTLLTCMQNALMEMEWGGNENEL